MKRRLRTQSRPPKWRYGNNDFFPLELRLFFSVKTHRGPRCYVRVEHEFSKSFEIHQLVRTPTIEKPIAVKRDYTEAISQFDWRDSTCRHAVFLPRIDLDDSELGLGAEVVRAPYAFAYPRGCSYNRRRI